MGMLGRAVAHTAVKVEREGKAAFVFVVLLLVYLIGVRPMLDPTPQQAELERQQQEQCVGIEWSPTVAGDVWNSLRQQGWEPRAGGSHRVLYPSECVR